MGETECTCMPELTEAEERLRRDGLRILARLIARHHLAMQQASRTESSAPDNSTETSAPERSTETNRS